MASFSFFEELPLELRENVLALSSPATPAFFAHTNKFYYNYVMKNKEKLKSLEYAKLVAQVSKEDSFDLLLFLHELKPGLDLIPVILAACSVGSIRIVQHFYSANVPKKFCYEMNRCAAENGHLPMLKWLLDHGVPSRKIEIMNAAVESGRLDILSWLKESGIEGLSSSQNTFNFAANSGNVKVFEWLKANGFQMKESAAVIAAKKGNLVALEWLVANSCPLDYRCAAQAAGEGHLQILEYLERNGCPMASDDPPVSLDSAMCEAAKCNRVESLEWLHQHGVHLGEHGLEMMKAVSHDSLEALAWLLAHKAPISLPALWDAVHHSRMDALQVIRKSKRHIADMEDLIAYARSLGTPASVLILNFLLQWKKEQA